MPGVPVPHALLRYVLAFLRVDAALLVTLARVSRAWQAALAAPGAVNSCIMEIEMQLDPVVDPQPRSLKALRGVRHLQLCCGLEDVMTASSLGQLTGLHQLMVPSTREDWAHAIPYHAMPSLHSLRAHSCSEQQLVGLTGVTKLMLTQEVTAAGMRHLTALRDLSLSGDAVASLTDEMCSHLSQLHTLELCDGMPGSTPATSTAFSHLAELTSLVLPPYCDAATSPEAFTALTRLARLDLGANEPREACFAYLSHLTWLDCSRCSEAITDSSFRHLVNMRSLQMWGCEGAVVTKSLFQAMTCLTELDISYCSQLSDEVFTHLSRVEVLHMSGCQQEAITDAAFSHLRSLQSLRMTRCTQETITDAAFSHLSRLTKLGIDSCWQQSITDAAFSHLRSLRELSMSGCAQREITDSAFSHLPGLRVLNMSRCVQLSDAAFRHLPGLTRLHMLSCSQEAITDAGFSHLGRLEQLNMSGCSQATISDAAFTHLTAVQSLGMKLCNQPTITNEAFRPLRRLISLQLGSPPLGAVTAEALVHLADVQITPTSLVDAWAVAERCSHREAP